MLGALHCYKWMMYIFVWVNKDSYIPADVPSGIRLGEACKDLLICSQVSARLHLMRIERLRLRQAPHEDEITCYVRDHARPWHDCSLRLTVRAIYIIASDCQFVTHESLYKKVYG
jgi:hypothetical protein